uniref:Uncharacterized protein n=1 Tax=Tanacetum cinerariifolium TaxID=118510 RepID=A0A699IZR3_TANCI|nr:hypothetical protein [Tanacetum cinerariifolium]
MDLANQAGQSCAKTCGTVRYDPPQMIVIVGTTGYKRQCCSLIPAESNSLPHAHPQTTIKKAQVLKTKTSANSDIKDPSSETKLQGRFIASFQDDSKYEHVGQDTRSKGSKDDQN